MERQREIPPSRTMVGLVKLMLFFGEVEVLSSYSHNYFAAQPPVAVTLQAEIKRKASYGG